MRKLTEMQQQNIYQEVMVGNKKIILLDVLGLKNLSKHELNANIYCVDSSFEIIWQIDAEPTKFEIDSFTSIKMNQDGLSAKRFSGFKYKIDIATGKAEITDWDK